MKRLLTLGAMALFVGALVSCDNNNGEIDITGTAVDVNSGAPVPAADFIVNDLERPAESQTVASGTSDAAGNYSVKTDQSTALFVVFPPEGGRPRVSGLIASKVGSANKLLNGATDVACIAGVTAVRTNQLQVDLLTGQRIANLEAAGAILIAEGAVDFSSADSVSAAAAEINRRTDFGANAP